jgi:hypothetical protein
MWGQLKDPGVIKLQEKMKKTLDRRILLLVKASATAMGLLKYLQ